MFYTLFAAIVIAIADAATTQPADPPTTRPVVAASLRPADLPSPGAVGFALYAVGMDADAPWGNAMDAEAMEALQFALIYGADRQLLQVRRGDALPKPFQDWRVVGIPVGHKRAGSYRPSIVVTNMDTKETIELEQVERLPSTRPVRIH